MEEKEPGRVLRFDRGVLNPSFETRDGVLLCEGFIAKPGVLEYMRPDGTTVRELVLPEELAKVDSLATLGRAPVTLEHPPEEVSPENFQEYGVGDLDGDIAVVSGGFIKIRFAVRRADAIESVKSGKTQELSPGYMVRIENTPGVHPVFGEYDVIQRDRRYNHAALTMAARGGSDIRLRADSAVAIEAIQLPGSGDEMNQEILDEMRKRLGVRADKAEAKADEDMPAAEEGKEDMGGGNEMAPEDVMKMFLKMFDGLKAERDDFRAKADERQAKIDEISASVAGAEPTPDAEKADEAPPEEAEEEPKADMEHGEEEEPEEAKMDSAGFLKLFNERLPLIELAREYKLDSVKVEKMDNAALRKAVALSINPNARKDSSDEYYQGCIDSARVASTVDPDAYKALELSVSERGDSASDEPAPTGVTYLQSFQREAK